MSRLNQLGTYLCCSVAIVFLVLGLATGYTTAFADTIPIDPDDPEEVSKAPCIDCAACVTAGSDCPFVPPRPKKCDTACRCYTTVGGLQCCKGGC